MLVSTKEILPSITSINHTPKTNSTTPAWNRYIHQCLKLKIDTYPTPGYLVPDFLDALPVELLLLIADFLLLEDIYCLSLCNRRLLALFRGQIKPQYYLERSAQLSFLRRLERDNPRYLACGTCLVLHSVDSISEPFELASPAHTYPPRVDCPVATFGKDLPGPFWMVRHKGFGTFSRYQLHFSHIHLAMRRFYCGPQYGISTDALSFTEVTSDFPCVDRVVSPITLFSIEAQICPTPPSLLLRIQDVMSMENTRLLLDDEDDFEPDQTYYGTLPACKHISKSFWMQNPPLNRYPTREYSTCDECNIDYETELSVNPSNGRMDAVMTSWINLGAGLSPNDPLWKINAGRMWGESDFWTEGLGYRHAGLSPRRTFEALTDTSLGDLTARNLSYLDDQRYETEMVPIPHSTPPTWALWNGAAIPW